MPDGMRVNIRVSSAPFSLAEAYADFAALPSAGAVVSFVGRMRDINDGDEVTGLTLEHYPGMTETVLAGLISTAGSRWSLEGVTLIHRVGQFAPCDEIVLVMVASQHRGEAFAACEFLMDYLKTRAPFWKKETLRDGSTRWVESRATDQQAAGRW